MNHKHDDTLPLDEACKGKRSKLCSAAVALGQMSAQRARRVVELQGAMRHIKSDTEEGVRSLSEAVDRSLTRLNEIQDKEYSLVTELQSELTKMASDAGAFGLSEDELLCSICLDVFRDPTSLPCGHSFCKSCIVRHWNSAPQCRCPLCGEQFSKKQKSKLKVNTTLRDVAERVRDAGGEDRVTSICHERPAGPGGVVSCDVCGEAADKSCLDCLNSYCHVHLQRHEHISGLRRHTLTHPVDNLEERLCKDHRRPLIRFCRTHQTLVCSFCLEMNHKHDDTLPLDEACEGKRSMLCSTAVVLSHVSAQRAKISELQGAMLRIRSDTEEGIRSLSDHKEKVDRSLAKLNEMQYKESSLVTELQSELTKEMEELLKRMEAIEKLSITEDHLDFLLKFPSLTTPLPARYWSVMSQMQQEDRVRRDVHAVVNEILGDRESRHVKELQERLNYLRYVIWGMLIIFAIFIIYIYIFFKPIYWDT